MPQPKPLREPRQPTLSRRTVFAGAGVAGAAAAVVAVLPGVAEKPEPATAATAPSAEGYRLTEHIQRYYKTARV